MSTDNIEFEFFLANLCLNVCFIRCVNILRAFDAGGIIKHVSAALIQSK